MTQNEDPKGRIDWWFEGDGVADGTAPVDQVVRMLVNLQRAVRILAERSDDDQIPRRRGPPKRQLAKIAMLRLVRVERGSFHATLELPTSEQPSMWNVGEQALHRLMDVLEAVAATGDIADVPDIIRPEVQALTQVVGDGIDAVVFEQDGEHKRVARFKAPVKLSVVFRASVHETTIHGRLREVDFKDHTAELYDATGQMTRVKFGAEQEAQLRLAANLYVTATGSLEASSAGKRATITLSDIEPLGAADEFWAAPDITEITLQQGVVPLTEETLARAQFWPADLDVDEFLAKARG